MKTIRTRILALVAVLALGASAAIASPAPAGDTGPANRQALVKSIRKELVRLPYYGVFDDLAFKVDGNTVTLYGAVVRPTTRSDAERSVAHLNGVARVINNIQVLPLSSFDDSIRGREYRTIFRTGSLYRYAMGSNPSIHIIVANGHVTLSGVVDSKVDSQLAYMAANSVPGVFSVTNNLQVGGGAH